MADRDIPGPGSFQWVQSGAAAGHMARDKATVQFQGPFSMSTLADTTWDKTVVALGNYWCPQGLDKVLLMNNTHISTMYVYLFNKVLVV